MAYCLYSKYTAGHDKHRRAAISGWEDASQRRTLLPSNNLFWVLALQVCSLFEAQSSACSSSNTLQCWKLQLQTRE